MSLSLSVSLTHTDYAAEHCVWSFDVRTKAQQCLMLSNVRENTTRAFTVYARNGKRNSVWLSSIEINSRFEVWFDLRQLVQSLFSFSS